MNDDAQQLLTFNQAVEFITNTLHVEFNMDSVVNHPIDFLTNVCKAIHRCVPFQSLSLLLVSRAFRRLPGHQQIKRDVVDKIGGCCYVLNVFLRELIRALNIWPTFYVRCAIHNVEDCHISVVLRGVMQPEDLWMVDVGCGYVLPQPMCLSFDGLESPVYQHGFLHVKFVRYDPTDALKQPHPDSIWRLHSASSTFDERELTLNREDQFNHVFWRMSLQPRPLHDAGQTQQVRAFSGYQKLRASLGIGLACSMIYFKADFVAGQLKARVLQDVEGQLSGTSVSESELIEMLTHYFPVFSVVDIQRALSAMRLE
jgi:arylamine N-acetyltransferase